MFKCLQNASRGYSSGFISYKKDEKNSNYRYREKKSAKLAENRKRQKYEPACQQLGLGFLPLAIESDGAFGKGLQDFIARCNSIAHGTSIAGTTWAASSFSSYWRQRISVCHRRGTAESRAEVPADKLPR